MDFYLFMQAYNNFMFELFSALELTMMKKVYMYVTLNCLTIDWVTEFNFL